MRLASPTTFLLIAWMILSTNLNAQTREEYAQHLNADETMVNVEQTLRSILNSYAGFLPATRKEQMASFFSFILTLNGYTGEKLQTLSEEGLDIGHAISANNRPLVEQSLMADYVIQGIVEEDTWSEDDTGNQIREITILVLDTYKGLPGNDKIIIRQRNGREYGENPAEAAPLTKGNTYLLLLNNGLFRYAVYRNTGDFPLSQSAEFATYFSIYRHYEMDGKRILWSGYNKRKTRKALEEVRWLDSLSD